MCGFVELGLDKKVKTAGQQAFLYVFFLGGGGNRWTYFEVCLMGKILR